MDSLTFAVWSLLCLFLSLSQIFSPGGGIWNKARCLFDEVCDNFLHLCSRLFKLLVRNPPLRVTQTEGTLPNTQLELHVCLREAEAAHSHGVGLRTGMTPTAAKSWVLTRDCSRLAWHCCTTRRATNGNSVMQSSGLEGVWCRTPHPDTLQRFLFCLLASLATGQLTSRCLPSSLSHSRTSPRLLQLLHFFIFLPVWVRGPPASWHSHRLHSFFLLTGLTLHTQFPKEHPLKCALSTTAKSRVCEVGRIQAAVIVCCLTPWIWMKPLSASRSWL